MEQLRLTLINDCNESRLPLDAIYFVVKDVLRDVQETLRRYQEEQVENIMKEETKEDE